MCLSRTLSQASYKELGLLALVVIMGMLIFSGLTFVVEKDANPDEFISLPAALYWAIITMTSVCAFLKTSPSLILCLPGWLWRHHSQNMVW